MSYLDRSPRKISINERTAKRTWAYAGEILHDLKSHGGPFATEDTVRAVARAANNFDIWPSEVRDVAAEFKETGIIRKGAVVLTGLTPPDELSDKLPLSTNKITETPDIVQQNGIVAMLTAAPFGPPISLRGNPRGAVDSFVTIAANLRGSDRGLSTPRKTGWHAEGTWDEIRPEAVALACLKGDSKVPLHIMPVRRLIRDLPDRVIMTLMEPNFRIPDGLVPDVDRPVITGTAENPAFNYVTDRSWVTAPTPDFYSQAALDYFNDYLAIRGEGESNTHFLKAGEVIVWSNKGLHCRPGPPLYTPESERTILRVFVGNEAHGEDPFVETPKVFPVFDQNEIDSRFKGIVADYRRYAPIDPDLAYINSTVRQELIDS
jgi:hypothetical protein